MSTSCFDIRDMAPPTNAVKGCVREKAFFINAAI